MKIAVLSSHTPSLFWFRTDMMREFIARGHEVVAIGNEPKDVWSERFEKLGIRYETACVSRNGTNPIKDIKAYRSLKAVLKAEMPDKIFTYQAKTVIYGTLAANSLGITEVYPLIAGIGSVLLSNSIKTAPVRWILKTEYRIALKKCPRVFFQNRDDIQVFTDGKMVSADKTEILGGSGVNTDKFRPTELPDGMAFLCVSRLIRDKGIMEYLNSARAVKSRYPDAKFMLVGPFDSNPSALTQKDIQPFIDDGTAEYYGETDDVRPYIARCNVFVLPSYREGTPKSVLEAMACGRAVITTDTAGCRETVENGINGFTVPVRNTEMLEKCMIKFITNPSIIPDMAKRGIDMVREKFDVKIVNNIICKVMGI